MTIRIVRNNNGNCITFVGSSQPAYWNSCLSGEVNSEDNTRVNVINDIRTTDSDDPFYEFFGMPYTEFVDAEGNSFADATETAAYITAKANVIGGQTITFGPTDTINATRDATNTNILFSTGDAFGVHAIKAIANADGNIDIVENITDGEVIYTSIRPANVTIGGDAPASLTANAVINALNSLFEVTPLGLGDVDPISSYVTTEGVPTITTFGDVSASGDYATKGTNTGDLNNDGIYTEAVIVAPGDHICLDWESTLTGDALAYGLNFVMGFKEGSAPVSEITSNTDLMGNLDLALRLKGLHVAENHDYGSVIENGYFNAPQSQNKLRLGLDTNRRLYIELYDADAEIWQVVIRSAFVTNDETYRVVFYIKDENARVRTSGLSTHITTDGIEELTYRYIESPDGVFHYPLFATEAEANFKDTQDGGPGTSTQNTFVDETPTPGTWHIPTTVNTRTGTSAPANTDNITYTEISTAADSGFVPGAFTIDDLTVDENTAVNYQVSPAGASWTTTVTGLPSGLSLSFDNIVGTSPEVAGTNDVTPNEVSTVTVTRTNSFGSTSSTFNITVTNITPPAPAINSWTHVTGSGAMVDADTLGDDSVMNYDDTTASGKRVVFSAAFVEGLFNSMGTTGSSLHAVFIGFVADNANLQAGSAQGQGWQDEDMKLGFRLHIESNGSKVVMGGGSMTSYGSGTFNRDLVLFHDFPGSGRLLMATTTAGTGATMATPVFYSNNDSATADAGDEQVIIAARETTVDVTDAGIAHYDNPSVPNNLTDWTKAVDFTGSSEHLLKASLFNGTSPLAMQRVAVTVAPPSTVGETADAAYASPWATAVVFQHDGNNSNQYIWNSAGAGNGDNIYLRMDSAGTVWFGWGRPDALNECEVTNLGTTTNTNHWHGIYVGFNGTRYNASNATAANLADVFDIRAMGTNDAPSAWSTIGQMSTAANWTAGSTGGHMGREFTGTFAIGGQGSSNNFHGKVASMVITVLRRGVATPTEAEIRLMITDPKKWIADYRVDQLVRNSNGSLNETYDPTDRAFGYGGTQVWLMGDGTNDSFSNGIRNQVHPTEINHTRLIFNNMVSDDIETVSITGLT